MSEEIARRLYASLPSFVNHAYNILGNRLEAEEAAQDALAKVWRNLRLTNPEKLLKYTHLAVRNACYDRLRRKRTVSIDDIDRDNLIQTPVNRLEAAIAFALRKEVDDLQEDFAGVIRDRYFDNLSYQEISEKRGISYATARTKLCRAMQKLREKIWANHPEMSSYQVA